MNQSDEFDINAFNETKSILKARFAETLDCFFEDSADYIRNIINGLANADIEAMLDNAHPLKSSSQAFGFTTLANLARDIEQTARRVSEGEGTIDDGVRENCGRLEGALGNAKERAGTLV